MPINKHNSPIVQTNTFLPYIFFFPRLFQAVMSPSPLAILAGSLATLQLVAGHSLILDARGNLGGHATGLGVDTSTPRDGTAQLPYQRDATYFAPDLPGPGGFGKDTGGATAMGGPVGGGSARPSMKSSAYTGPGRYALMSDGDADAMAEGKKPPAKPIAARNVQASTSNTGNAGRTGLQNAGGRTGLQNGNGRTGLQNGGGRSGLQNQKGRTGLQNGSDRTGLQNGGGRTGLQNGNDRTGLQNGGGRTGLQNGNDRTGLQNGGDRTGLQNGNGRTGLQNGNDRTGLQNGGGRTGLQNGNDRTGLQNGDRTGLQNGNDRTGLQNGGGRTGLQNGNDRTGLQNGNDRTGLQNGDRTGLQNGGGRTGLQNGNGRTGLQNGNDRTGLQNGNPANTDRTGLQNGNGRTGLQNPGAAEPPKVARRAGASAGTGNGNFNFNDFFNSVKNQAQKGNQAVAISPGSQKNQNNNQNVAVSPAPQKPAVQQPPAQQPPAQQPNNQNQVQYDLDAQRKLGESEIMNPKGVGYTMTGGPNRIDRDVALAIQNAGGQQMPQVTRGGELYVTLYQVNSDGAGPYGCFINNDGTGRDWTRIPITQNMPGDRGRSGASNMSRFPLTTIIPNSQQCNGKLAGQDSVCLVRCQNAAEGGPFGGVVPVQLREGGAAQGANNGTAVN